MLMICGINGFFKLSFLCYFLTKKDLRKAGQEPHLERM